MSIIQIGTCYFVYTKSYKYNTNFHVTFHGTVGFGPFNLFCHHINWTNIIIIEYGRTGELSFYSMCAAEIVSCFTCTTFFRRGMRGKRKLCCQFTSTDTSDFRQHSLQCGQLFSPKISGSKRYKDGLCPLG